MTYKLLSGLFVLNLQLFSDGNAAAPGAATAGTTATVVTGGENTPSASNPIEDKATATPKVIYGKQENNSTPTEKVRKSFEDIVKSDDYKEEAKAYFDKTFQRRMKTSQETISGLEAENAKMKSILDMNNLRYGLDPNSDTYLDDYAAKVQGDRKLYEDEALAAGMDVDSYIKVKNAERVLAQNEKEMERRQNDELLRGHIERLTRESQEFVKQFPNFNIEAELQNPRFRKLVDPAEYGGSGLSVEDAFYAVHHNDIIKSYAQNAASQATTQVANAVATNQSRPKENGLSSSTPSIIKDDPSKLTLDDFKKIQEEYHRTGVRVSF